jgi:hypothetical protein
MSAPVYGCPSCETTAGSMGCPIHGQRVYPAGVSTPTRHIPPTEAELEAWMSRGASAGIALINSDILISLIHEIHRLRALCEEAADPEQHTELLFERLAKAAKGES